MQFWGPGMQIGGPKWSYRCPTMFWKHQVHSNSTICAYGALGASLSIVGSFMAQLGSWVEYLLNLREVVAKLLRQEARMLRLMLGWVRRCRMEVMI